MATGLQRHLTDPSPAGPPAGPPPAARVRGLTRRFGARTVISALDLDLARGEFVALLGASGCGKSTLLRILAGLDAEIEGEAEVTERRAVAFQAPRLMPWKRVWRNVVLGLPGRPDRAVAERALAEVGLARHAEAWPKDLSGARRSAPHSPGRSSGSRTCSCWTNRSGRSTRSPGSRRSAW